jgi:uncharacterized protein
MRYASFVLLFLFGTVLWAQDIPQPMSPPRLLNDYVGMLNPTENATLEQKLRGYADSTSTQITVVVVKSTLPYPAGDYAFELGRRWGVGQKGKNNGIVLLWATDDRKIFIATGRGMEGAIPDVIAKRIIREVISPDFKNQMYYRGLNNGVDEIVKYATGEYKSDGTESDEDIGLGVLIFIIILIVIIIIIFSNINRGGGGRRRSYHDGGGWIPYTTYSGWGSSSGSWGDSGNSGGGGFDFGGFGGGDFGGGGAGGDY